MEQNRKTVTVRVPATTANLGPGFDAFGCALQLYTDVTFEETDSAVSWSPRAALSRATGPMIRCWLTLVPRMHAMPKSALR